MEIDPSCSQCGEAEVIPEVLKHLEVPMLLERDRPFLVPYDCKVGWNRGEWSEANPDGLKDWAGEDRRSRTPPVSWLDKKRTA